jgi:hypothetical protein
VRDDYNIFFDMISDFARILAPCRANNSTYQTLPTSSFKCVEDGCLVGLVDLKARHSAKIRAKNWYFTAYLVLKDASSPKTVCARTERLSVPVIYG